MNKECLQLLKIIRKDNLADNEYWDLLYRFCNTLNMIQESRWRQATQIYVSKLTLEERRKKILELFLND